VSDYTPGQPPRPLRDGEPCGHPGCLSHVSHPCEGCGRVWGRWGGGGVRGPSECGEGALNLMLGGEYTLATDREWGHRPLLASVVEDGVKFRIGGDRGDDLDYWFVVPFAVLEALVEIARAAQAKKEEGKEVAG
jgi:hypothetical protein